jgi:orotate phosphoribosyltransferase-like protein
MTETEEEPTKKELIEKAKEQLEKGDSPTNFRGEINFTKATALILLALYEQNEEIIRQNEIIIQYPK